MKSVHISELTKDPKIAYFSMKAVSMIQSSGIPLFSFFPIIQGLLILVLFNINKKIILDNKSSLVYNQ